MKKSELRQIIREEIQKLQIKPLIEDIEFEIDDYSISVDILSNGEKVGYIILEKEKDNEYSIVDSKIEPEFRGKGLYYKSIIELLENNPKIKINSVFRSESAELAWEAMMNKLPDHIGIKKKKYPEGTTLYQIFIKN
jgi:hypothetical protein